jgi:SAM-dependent methyltransferase
MNKTSRAYRRVFEALEHPWVYNLNQVFFGAGKKRHVTGFLRGLEYHSVLDIGCGPGEYVELARGPYLGIDTSASYIASCRRRFGNDPTKQFVHADATTITVPMRYDLALLNSVLHHLTDEETERLVAWVAHSARYLFILDLYPVPWNPLSRWFYSMDRGDYLRDVADQKALILRHPAMRLVKEGAKWSPNCIYRHSLFLFESVASQGN